MKALAKEVAPALGFVAIGVVVSLAVVLAQGVEASPDPGVSRVLRGMDPYYGQTCWPWYDPDLPGYHPCWHDEDFNRYTAADFDYGDSAGREVRLYLSGYEYFRILEYTGTCKGVRAGIYWGHPVYGDYRGDVHYLHIDVLPDVIGRITTGPYLPLGHVAEYDNPGCPWDGAHLHQSARITAETPFYTNKLRDPTEGDNWVHAILWEAGGVDSDYDDFINQDELYIDTDPFDDCADTGTPNDEHPDPWPPDFDDNRVVDITDAGMFIDAFPSALGSPGYDARFDLQPNGLIDISDASIFLNHFPSSCGE